MWRRFDRLRAEHDEMFAAVQKAGPFALLRPSGWRAWRELDRKTAETDAALLAACRHHGDDG